MTSPKPKIIIEFSLVKSLKIAAAISAPPSERHRQDKIDSRIVPSAAEGFSILNKCTVSTALISKFKILERKDTFHDRFSLSKLEDKLATKRFVI